MSHKLSLGLPGIGPRVMYPSSDSCSRCLPNAEMSLIGNLRPQRSRKEDINSSLRIERLKCRCANSRNTLINRREGGLFPHWYTAVARRTANREYTRSIGDSALRLMRCTAQLLRDLDGPRIVPLGRPFLRFRWMRESVSGRRLEGSC